MAVVVILLILWILCWAHAIMRMRTGGRSEVGPGPYCCDPNVKMDGISAAGISWGTIILVLLLLFS